jgi:hypothetical protein
VRAFLLRDVPAGEDGKDAVMCVQEWDLATGERRLKWRKPKVETSRVVLSVMPVFSPDGRVLAASGHTLNPKFPLAPTILYDLATGRELQGLSGHESSVTAAAFAPDGRTLTTGHLDGSALVWDVTPAQRRVTATAEREAGSLERAWTALAGEDAAAAQVALATLSASPEQATAFLRNRLRPAAPLDASAAQLVADLDSDEFRVREAAARELVHLGPQVEAPLRAALAANPSAELRRQAEALLEKLEGPPADVETLRQLRAIAALERLPFGWLTVLCAVPCPRLRGHVFWREADSVAREPVF